MTQEGLQRVDLVGSYARRSGTSVQLILRLPDRRQPPASTVRVRLKGQRRTARTTAQVSTDGPDGTVELRASVDDLRPDIYRLAIQETPEGPFQRLEARLLTTRNRPIALLPGPVPRTRMPAPRPVAPASHHRPRVVQVAAAVVNKGLDRLPDDRADRYRATLRGLAHKVVPG